MTDAEKQEEAVKMSQDLTQPTIEALTEIRDDLEKKLATAEGKMASEEVKMALAEIQGEVEKLISSTSSLSQRVAGLLKQLEQAQSAGEGLSRESAWAIMGSSFISPADVISKLGVKYSSGDLLKLAKIPFSDSVLRECKDSHVLFPSFPLSILETREKAPNKLFYSYSDAWYNGHSFAHSERPEVRWHLIRKERVPCSNSKTYSQQLAMLSDKEENPPAVVLVQLMVIYQMMTGTKLFIWEKSDGVRSSSLSSGGNRVGVDFDGGRLNVNFWDDDGCNSGLGLASSRKFQN